MRVLSAIISTQEKRTYHPYSFILFCSFTGLMRGVLELFLHDIQLRNTDIVGFIPFYLSVGLMLREMLAYLTGQSREKIEKSLILGIFLGLFPPVFDLFLPAPVPVFYGYYFLWNFASIPWFGYNPNLNFPAGECVTIWLSIFFSAGYVHVKTKKLWRTLLASVIAYGIFLFSSSIFPMLLFRASQGFATTLDDIRAMEAIRLQMFLFRLCFWQAVLAATILIFSRKGLLLHTLYRLLHGLPFICLAILGATMVKASASTTLLASTALTLAIILAVWQNDHFDFREDGHKEPLVTRSELQAFTVIAVLAVFFLFIQNQRSSVLIFIAMIASTLYNYPFYRARNSFPSNIKIEGIWGLSAFLVGALLDPVAAQNFSVKVTAVLIFSGWSSVSIWKDLKDVEKDQQAGVRTLFTILIKKQYAKEGIIKVFRITITTFFLIPPVLAYTVISPIAALILIIAAFLPIACLWAGTNQRAFQWGLVAVSANILAIVSLLKLEIWKI